MRSCCVLSRVSLASCAAVVLAAMTTLGCATESVADRHFAEMREQVSKMQAEHDKLDQRIGALEVAVADEKSGGQTVLAPNPSPGTPAAGAPARTVQLGGPADEAADPNDPSARPDIRVTGQAGSAVIRPRGGKVNARGRVEESDPSPLGTARPDSVRPSALDPEAKRAYEAALAQVQGKQFAKGLDGLSAFLVRWPDHPYAENAMYWRGEAYFGQGEYLRAAEQFEAVLARFGGGNKGPDALLKLGMCHDRLGASQRAREYWDRLKAEYPKSDAAKRIPQTARESTKGPKENR